VIYKKCGFSHSSARIVPTNDSIQTVNVELIASCW